MNQMVQEWLFPGGYGIRLPLRASNGIPRERNRDSASPKRRSWEVSQRSVRTRILVSFYHAGRSLKGMSRNLRENVGAVPP
jgi:hypothetical protein